MKPATNQTFPIRKSILRLLVVTVIILFIPLIAMQFSNEVDWDIADFTIMALLINSVGGLYIFLLRRYPKIPIPLAIMCLIMFIYVWIELAVGIFFSSTN